MKIKLEKGDVFLTRNPMMLGRMINAVQRFWSQDNKSVYSHAGVIISEEGDTFEALWTIKASHIKEYEGKDIAIYRHKYMTHNKFYKGMKVILGHKGKIYPFYRLALMIFPPAAKHLSFGGIVCSEVLGKFLNGCGTDIQWRGLTPDGSHDFMKNHRDFDLVFQGKLKMEDVL